MAFQQVQAQFAAASNYANSATGRAQNFINALNAVAGGLQAPQLQFDETWPEAPSREALPDAASITLPSTNFPSDWSGGVGSAPAVSLPTDPAPLAPALGNYTYTPGVAPTKPTLDALSTVMLPAAPETWVPPAAPALLTINVQPFAGVNNHSSWLTQLENAPADLTLAAPAPFAPPCTNKYDSALLSEMVGLLRQRLQGGTGIAPAVEQAIWDRGRAREALAAESNIAEVMRTSEARGFTFPDGALHAAMREAGRVSLAKSAELSREISIKQAELEQANARHAIEQGVALEGRLIEYANNIEQRAFDAARFVAQNAVEIYNALVSKYRVALEKYSTTASVYRSLIEGEVAKVNAYRAAVEAESIKADVNKSLIEEQRLQIEVRNARIEAYKAELEGVQALLAVDKLKIEGFAERIRAYVAELEAETTRVEAFKAQVNADQARADIYRTQVEAHVAKINAASTTARTRAEIYDAEVRAFATRVQAYGTRVSAEAEKARTAVSVEGLKVEVAKLSTEQALSNNQTQIEQYKALIAGYEASKQVAIQQAKLLSDNYFTLKSILADAAKVGAQVNAQMAASAYGTLHASAAISGTAATSTHFSYSGDTSDTRAAPNY
jgi:hypothetical protein